VWTVRREWLKRMPRWRKLRVSEGSGKALDFVDAPGCDFDLEGLLVVAAVVAVLLALWFFIIPALIFLADLLVLLIIAAIGVAIWVLFRRPWNVVAATDGPPAERVMTPVVGFRASGAKVAELAYRIEREGSPLAQ